MRKHSAPKLLITQANSLEDKWQTQECMRKKNLNFAFKRIVDVTASAALLLLLSPLLVLIALAIRCDSDGPSLYKQDRVGARRSTKNGRVVWETHTFRLYKFRSMFRNADPAIHQVYIKAFIAGQGEIASADGTKFKLDDDRRITRVGKMLRRTSLDELPQLFNVLKGEMSLVGPRPVPTYEVAEYEEWHRARLLAKPGITGLWQVKARGRVSFDEMVRMDIEYARNQSVWLDLKLLWLTIPSVLSGRGAK
jgi:lipopolysaccharide/colanic/teichoic acid biosynthesis glycosyltransferase